MSEFYQIRKVRLTYDQDTVVPLPKNLNVLQVIVTPDAQDKLNVPYLVYMHRGGADTELKTLRLISGEAELDYTHEQFNFLGAIPHKKRHHPNFASLFLVTKKKSHPSLQPAEPPKKKVTPPNPESVKAREAAQEREAKFNEV